MFDYYHIENISLLDLQREPLLQTMHGKMETREINLLLQNAKVVIDPLQGFCSMTDTLLLTYLEENYLQQIKMEPVVVLPPSVEHPFIDINVSNDRMVARVTIKEPPKGTPAVTVDDVVSHLRNNSIVYGVKNDVITSAIIRKDFGRSLLAAVGKQALPGTDRKITFDYDIFEDIAPRLLQDDEYDYQDLSGFRIVKQGDVVCKISLETCGTDGINIYGRKILAQDGEPLQIEYGNNIELSTDGKSLVATCDGQVVVKDNKVTVVKVMQFEQVDAANGNIMFPGSVYIEGDLKSAGFLRIGGDIYVKGLISSGKILCNGNIITAQGITGTGTGVSITAKGCVRSKFIEFAEIKTEKTLYADSITQSEITCGNSLMLNGQHGCFVGGKCSLTADLVAKQIGNESGVETIIEIDGLTAVREEKVYCEDLIEKYNANIKRVHSLAIANAKGATGNIAKMRIVARLLYIEHRTSKEIKRLIPRVEVLSDIIEQNPPGQIKVTDTMHQNVTLVINEANKRSAVEKQKFFAYKKRDNIRFKSNIEDIETDE